MLHNYILVALRASLRSIGYSLINVAGLAVGMAVALLIGMWVYDELSYNKSFDQYDRIAQVNHHITFGETMLTISDTPAPLAEKMKLDFPDFEEVAVAGWPKDKLVQVGDKRLTRSGMFVDPSFLKIFTVQFTKGSGKSFTAPGNILVSQSLADNLIGADPIGKMVKVDNRDEFLVSGVFPDFPDNSSFNEVQLLIPMSYYFNMGEAQRKQRTNWDDYSTQTFVLLREGANAEEVGKKITHIIYDNGSGDMKSVNPTGFLLPMDRWHFYAEYKDGKPVEGKIRLVWMFAAIGSLALVLACINFMNLSTARSEKRSKEVGIRKVMGSARAQLIRQFLSESLLMVLVSTVLALLLGAVALPFFNGLASKQISMPWTNPDFYKVLGIFILITTLLAGAYPAFMLSSFKPVSVLKGTFRVGRTSVIARKSMVVFQFTISTALMVMTVIVFQQIQHAKDRPTGFEVERLIQVPVNTLDLGLVNYNTLRHDLLQTGFVENMAKSDFPTTGASSGEASLMWEGKDPAYKPLIPLNVCSHDFPATNGFQFVKGRDFSRDFRTDSLAMIVTESAAQIIAPDGNILGKKVTFGSGKVREIVGVIKDQIRWSPFAKPMAHMYLVRYEELGCLTIKLKEGISTRDGLAAVEDVVKKHAPAAPFEYEFIDEAYAKQFRQEERIGKLTTVFASLAIFISAIGIFGLASFSASRRTKEIGIRKVLGATVFNVWRLLSSDFVMLTFLSAILAAPIAWYFGEQWLGQYEYRITISWWLFVASAAATLLITLLTVSYQSLKAAILNPAVSLKSE